MESNSTKREQAESRVCDAGSTMCTSIVWGVRRTSERSRSASRAGSARLSHSGVNGRVRNTLAERNPRAAIRDDSVESQHAAAPRTAARHKGPREHAQRRAGARHDQQSARRGGPQLRVLPLQLNSQET